MQVLADLSGASHGASTGDARAGCKGQGGDRAGYRTRLRRGWFLGVTSPYELAQVALRRRAAFSVVAGSYSKNCNEPFDRRPLRIVRYRRLRCAHARPQTGYSIMRSGGTVQLNMVGLRHLSPCRDRRRYKMEGIETRASEDPSIADVFKEKIMRNSLVEAILIIPVGGRLFLLTRACHWEFELRRRYYRPSRLRQFARSPSCSNGHHNRCRRCK